MSLDIAFYNRQFLEKVAQNEPIYDDAGTKYGVGLRGLAEISLSQGADTYWRVVGIHHLTGIENMGNHHVYADVLDEDGRRINNSRLVLTQGNASPVFAVIDKPANEAGTNFPIWKLTRVTVAVQWPDGSPLASEAVTDLRTDHNDEEVGTTWGHHSFYIVFQRTKITDDDNGGGDNGGGDNGGDDNGGDDNGGGDNGGGETPLTLEETIALTGQKMIIPLNPEAMFYKAAQQHKLGERLTSEYDTTFQGKTYRAQIYEKGIVYAEVGDWGNVMIIPRTN